MSYNKPRSAKDIAASLPLFLGWLVLMPVFSIVAESMVVTGMAVVVPATVTSPARTPRVRPRTSRRRCRTRSSRSSAISSWISCRSWIRPAPTAGGRTRASESRARPRRAQEPANRPGCPRSWAGCGGRDRTPHLQAIRHRQPVGSGNRRRPERRRPHN